MFHLSASKSLEDSPLRLEDRLADIPFSAISASLYSFDNEHRTVILEDMADFLRT